MSTENENNEPENPWNKVAHGVMWFLLWTGFGLCWFLIANGGPLISITFK